MGDYLKKHHPPRHQRKIHTNALLKTDHNTLHKWANGVLTKIHKVSVTPVHMLSITQNRNVLQGCANVIRTYGHTKWRYLE